MKILDRLEHSKAFWTILGLGFLFFLLRLPSLFEPNWYGDEGVYQVIGQALDHGRILYAQIWDNKPPLLYVTYALFGGEQFWVRLASLVSGLMSTICFFLLSQKLFKKLSISVITTSLFVVLFGIPFLEGNIANAENFILFPIILAGLLIYNEKLKTKHLKLILAGLLLGLAFLFKIVAIFDLVAFLLFFVLNIRHSGKRSASRIRILESLTLPRMTLESLRQGLFFCLGFLIPLVLTIIYFALNNALPDFFQAAFLGQIGYVGYANEFIIPQGFLILKIVLLVIAVGLIFWKRKVLSPASLFIVLWVAFSLFNAFFSQRPYTHYALVLLPSFCLLVGLVITSTKKTRILFLVLLVGILVVVTNNFKLTPAGLSKSVQYYQNSLLFTLDKKDVSSYQAFFDQKTPRDYELVAFINKHTTPSDSIFVWGDSPQIYALSHKLPPTKYTVAYHTLQNKNGIQETETAIKTTKPKYIITLAETQPLPFQLPQYVLKFNLREATIYERTF